MAKQLPLTADFAAKVQPAVPPCPPLFFIQAYSVASMCWKLIPSDGLGFLSQEMAENKQLRLGGNWLGSRVVRIPGDAATATEKGA